MGVQQPESMLQLDSGKGLLDARAMWAAMVGPHRLAMANKYPFELYNNKATQLHRNLGADSAYVFIGVALPADVGVITLNTVFGKDDSLGANSGAPYVLSPQMGGGGFGPNGFMQLLLPGEELYAQIVGPGMPTQVRVTVAKVIF